MKKNQVKVLVIIQARNASSRLPGKILMKLDGKPLIQHTIERAKKSRFSDKVILATSDSPTDNPVAELCINEGFEHVRGPEEDVLKRFMIAAEPFKPELIVRICGDEPLLDPEIIDKSIELHRRSCADYSTTCGTVPNGLDVEIINYDVLKKVDEVAEKDEDREHVTRYILNHPSSFKIETLDFGKKLARPDIKLTVDTQEDLEFIKKIYFALKDEDHDHLAESIIRLIDNHTIVRKKQVLIRADGSKEKGMGDIITCLNIAETLKDEYEFTFVSKDHNECINFIKNKGYEVMPLNLEWDVQREISKIKELCRRRGIKHAIIELVPNNPDYVKELSSFMKTLMIDFEGNIDVYADILVCWNILAEKNKYVLQNPHTSKLLGVKYLPLKQTTVKYRKEKYNNDIRDIVITFGGSDPHNLSFLLLETVTKINKGYRFKLIVGPSFKKIPKIKTLSKKVNVDIIYAPSEMHKILQNSDLVISGGGFTSFELASMGIPFIGISKISWEIERLKELESRGMCVFISPDESLTQKLAKQLQELSNPEIRREMGKNGKTLIDGLGLSRIKKELKHRW
jgi:spore coat polysaccharide biosynthesis protein SpsF